VSDQNHRRPECHPFHPIAPPMWTLVTLNAANEIVPSDYAVAANDAGLEIITWTIERSGPLAGGWYYQTTTDTIDNNADMLKLLDVLAWDVGITVRRRPYPVP